MKATPIAQYLDQQSRGSADGLIARREISPFKPRAVSSRGPEEAVSTFRRSGLIAAVGGPSAEAEESPGAAPGATEAPRRESVLLRPRAAPNTPDIETRLSEAYHRGVQEGLDAAKAEAATARALERAETQKRAVVERLDFQMNEYAKFADMIANGLAEVESRISEVVTRILQPFLTEAISSQIVDELAENIARLRQAGRSELLRARGPERLLSALKARIESLAFEVEYVEQEGVEISVEAGPTLIRSELEPWARLIASLTERD